MDLDSNTQVTFMFLINTFSAPYCIEIGINATRSNKPYCSSLDKLNNYESISAIIFKDWNDEKKEV